MPAQRQTLPLGHMGRLRVLASSSEDLDDLEPQAEDAAERPPGSKLMQDDESRHTLNLGSRKPLRQSQAVGSASTDGAHSAVGSTGSPGAAGAEGWPDSEGTDPVDFRALLAAQLLSAQEALASQHEVALNLAAKHSEDVRRTESRLLVLQKENAELHELCAISPADGALPPTTKSEEAKASAALRRGSEAQSAAEEDHVVPPPKPLETQWVQPPMWSAPGMAAIVASTELQPFAVPPPGEPEEAPVRPIASFATHRSADEAGSQDSTRSTDMNDLKALRSSGKMVYKLHESWWAKDGDPSQLKGMGRSGFLPKKHRAMTSAAVASLKEAQEDGLGTQVRNCKNGVLSPNSKLRVVWDFFSLAFVLYDVTVIPLQLLDMPKSEMLVAMGMMTRLFWTVDMPLSFSTGFVRANGSIEMGRGAVTIKYLKNWFLVDVVILIVDWLDVAENESGGNWAGLGKASRGFRLIRMVRLIRVVRINKRFESLMEYITSERLLIVVDIVKNMFIILGASHFIACVWASIDTSDRSWSIVSGFAGLGITPLYLMAFHWALSQFSGGMDEVTPGTELERIFAVLVLLIAFIAASIFVSSITSSMTQLTIINSQESQQLSVLKKYLHRTGITKGLSTRIMNNAQHMLVQRQRHLDEAKVEILGVISEPLRVELHFEIYTQPLSSHPFFRVYVEDSPNVVRRVCHRAMRMWLVSRGDSLFVAGEIPANPSMYIVCRGELTYTSMQSEATDVGNGDWVSEGTLWLSNWRHMGELVADIESCLCILDAELFRTIAANFQHLTRLNPRAYAGAFVEAINECESEAVTDLPLNSAKLYERYTSFHEQSRRGMRTTIRGSLHSVRRNWATMLMS